MGATESIACGKRSIQYDRLDIHFCHIGDLVLYGRKLYLVVGLSKSRCAIIYTLPMTHDNSIDFHRIPDEKTMLRLLKNRKKLKGLFLYPYIRNLTLIHSSHKCTWDECINNLSHYWVTSGAESRFKKSSFKVSPFKISPHKSFDDLSRSL